MNQFRVVVFFLLVASLSGSSFADKNDDDDGRLAKVAKGAAMGVATVSGSATVLAKVGFTAVGVAKGSIAAAIQSGIGNVAAGSIFAGLQSMGATGGLALLGPFGVTLGGGVAAGYYFFG